jgi:hypothetical protein
MQQTKIKLPLIQLNLNDTENNLKMYCWVRDASQGAEVIHYLNCTAVIISLSK